MHETLQLLSAGPRRQASAVCVCVCVCVCVRARSRTPSCKQSIGSLSAELTCTHPLVNNLSAIYLQSTAPRGSGDEVVASSDVVSLHRCLPVKGDDTITGDHVSSEVE